MTREKLEEVIRGAVERQMQVDSSEVTPGTLFVEDLGADSLDVIELVMEFEESFGISITESEANKAKTFKEAVDLIEAKLVKKSNPAV